MKRTTLLFALVLSATAQATTLKEVLEAAETKNLDRQISAAQRRRAAAEFRQAWTAMLPSLAVQSGWTYNQFPTEVALPGGPSVVITPQNQLDGTLRVELPLVDTGRWFRAAASGALLDAAEYREDASRDAVIRQVATTYFGFAASLALRESAKRSLAVSEEQLKLQVIRNNAGSATELEVLRARAEAERARQTLADADALVANNRRALRTLSGVEAGDAASLPPDDLTPVGSLEQLEGNLEQLPAVKAAEKDAEAASRLATASRLALVPSVTANFTERVTNATGFSGRNDSFTAGIGLAWRLDGPTFFGMDVQAAQSEIARLSAERQRLASRDQVHTDWQRLNSAIKKVTAAEAQVKSAERAAQVARDRYAVGAAAQLEVIQAERDLFSAEVNQIQARTELASSHVGLRISSGLSLNP